MYYHTIVPGDVRDIAHPLKNPVKYVRAQRA